MYYENKNSYREEKNTIQTGSVEETVVVSEIKLEEDMKNTRKISSSERS